MIRLFFSIFITGVIFASTSVLDDCLDIVARTPQAQYDLYADMRLSQYPGHPNPPIYEIIFPNGQKLLILGTTHTIPLECLLSLTTAKSIIEASAFSVNEIKGVVLPREGKICILKNALNGEIQELGPLYVDEEYMGKMANAISVFYLNISP